jgi:threonine synthase
MKFISTRGHSGRVSFSEALKLGLAPDGGLFVPEKFPHKFKENLIDFKNDLSLDQFATKVLAPFLENDPLENQLSKICEAAFNFPVPLRFLPDGLALLELFHGPTAAFKDVGARFLAECVTRQSSFIQQTVLVATSGDTGGAVASAFFGKPNIEVFILFPKGRISLRQEKQITAWGGNVRAFAVHGTFDDCQKIVKAALSDQEWRSQKNFVSANSISLGRLLPQMVYHAKASLEFQKNRGQKAGIIVPTGNLGNAMATLWAKQMGFPIDRVLLATNANRSLEDFFSSGVWNPQPTAVTLANAMDVGNPSNFERLQSLYPQIEELKKDVCAVSITDAEISQAIRDSFYGQGEIFCPHTATAVVAQKKWDPNNSNWILVSTAHPAKFENIVEPLIGAPVPVPPSLAELLSKKSVYEEIEPTLADFKSRVHPSV